MLIKLFIVKSQSLPGVFTFVSLTLFAIPILIIVINSGYYNQTYLETSSQEHNHNNNTLYKNQKKETVSYRFFLIEVFTSLILLIKKQYCGL